MTFESFWLFVTKVGIPALGLYAAWLQAKLSTIMQTLEQTRQEVVDHKLLVAKDYVPKDSLEKLEARLVVQIQKIDSKLDRLLEQEARR